MAVFPTEALRKGRLLNLPWLRNVFGVGDWKDDLVSGSPAAPVEAPAPTHKFALVACARWETDSIVEWLLYHRHIGFDHVYLYCNDDDPTELYGAVLPFTLGRDPFLTFLHHPIQGEQAQMYRHFLRLHAKDCEWAAFFDIDEFLVLRRGLALDELANAHGADVVYFNWCFVGPNGHKTRPSGPVWKNYPKRSDILHPFTKALFRTSAVDPERLGVPAFWHDMSALVRNDAKILDVAGNDRREYYKDFPHEAARHCNDADFAKKALDTAFIFHVFLKSEADAIRKAQRGTGGDFYGQALWRDIQAQDQAEFDRVMTACSVIPEFRLQEIWSDILSGARKSTLD